MTDRAFKFLADNTKKFQYVKGKLYIMTDTVPDLLERFHAQCLPTNREIYSKFGKANNTIMDIDNTLLIRGATWCRDFVSEEPKKEKLICCGCGQDISGNAIFENHLSFHNESCIRMLKYMGEFMFGKPKAVDNKVSPTKKKKEIMVNCTHCIFSDPKDFLKEPCCHCLNYQCFQPKKTLEEEINAFDTEKYWLDELLKTTERQSEILKKLIEVKSKKK